MLSLDFLDLEPSVSSQRDQAAQVLSSASDSPGRSRGRELGQPCETDSGVFHELSLSQVSSRLRSLPRKLFATSLVGR